MDAMALRNWGIAATAALMVGALALAAQPAGRASAEAPPAAMNLAQAPAQSAPVAFLVRFRGNGPIARAQAAAVRGREARARREIEAQLARQQAFAGLCFDRFTVGAAEVVLRSCEPIAASARGVYQERWLARLGAMRAVAYVDANATASQDRAPG